MTRLILFCISILFLNSGSNLLLSQDGGLRIVYTDPAGEKIPLYRKMHAVVIGATNYQHWGKLDNAISDAKKAATLFRDLGFEVTEVMDPNSADLKKALNKIAYEYTDANDAILVFYAGHGATEKLSDDEELGYIVPVDAPLRAKDPGGFASLAVSMKEIESYALRIKCKHVLFIFDSCFSGSIFPKRRASPEHIAQKTTKPVRQFITSGSAEEEVPDKSKFFELLSAGLKEGEADMTGDRYVTGTELGMYLQDNVVKYSTTTPQYGKINNFKLDKGDFVFPLFGADQTVQPSAAQKKVDGTTRGDSVAESSKPTGTADKQEEKPAQPSEAPTKSTVETPVKNAIQVWRVGSRQGETPDETAPLDLRVLAGNFGADIKITGVTAKEFAQKFNDAMLQNEEPEIIVGNDQAVFYGGPTEFGEFPGIYSSKRVQESLVFVFQSLAELQVQPVPGSFEFLVSTAKNFEMARALALRPAECFAEGFYEIRGADESELNHVAQMAIGACEAFILGDEQLNAELSDPERLWSTSGYTGAQISDLSVCSIYGNSNLAFAQMKATYEYPAQIGQQQLLAVLRKIAGEWAVLAVCGNDATAAYAAQLIPSLYPLLTVEQQWPPEQSFANLYTPDGTFPVPYENEMFGSFAWEPVLAAEVLLEVAEFAAGSNSDLFFFTEPSGFLSGEYVQAMDAMQRWRVWTVYRDGTIALSETRSFFY